MATVISPIDATETDGVASRLARLFELALGQRLPLRLRAWDESEVGPLDAPLVTVSSALALRRLATAHTELGLARAYVAGEVDIDGDPTEALRLLFAGLSVTRATRPGFAARLKAGIEVARLAGVGLPPAPPPGEARLRGRRHSVARDRSVIAHHYDLSNAFYALVLDETMAYSCAYWTSDHPSFSLADAQRAKLDLVCTKLGLRPGTRLLDAGCGWGSLTMHAAQHFGASVTALTLSPSQADHVRQRAGDLGLASSVEVVCGHYRDRPPEPHDAVSSIEMGEHVGKDRYLGFATWLRENLRPGGRLLLQQMARPHRSPGGGPFIGAYIAPDMYMRPVGETVALLEDAGFEVRDVHGLRAHYARTCHEWAKNLARRTDEAVALVGEETVRVWRLYLSAIAVGFELSSTGVDQILARRPGGEPEGIGLEAWRASMGPAR